MPAPCVPTLFAQGKRLTQGLRPLRCQGERRTRGPALEKLKRECGRFRDKPIGQAVALILESLGRELPPPEDDVILLGFEV